MIEFIYTLLTKMHIGLPPTGRFARNVDRWNYYDRTISKFPLSHKEVGHLRKWDDSSKSLVALDKMLELFDPSKTAVFYPGEILKWMLQTQAEDSQEHLCLTVKEGMTYVNSAHVDPYVRAAKSYCEAANNTELARAIIDQAVKNVGKLRDSGGEVYLHFFNALLTLQNDAIFEEHPDKLYDYVLYKSRGYVIPLLVCEDDMVRKGTMAHCEELFNNHKADYELCEETKKFKYQAIRRLISDMSNKIINEHVVETPRSLVEPLISIYKLLLQTLHTFMRGDDPDREEVLSGTEDELLYTWTHHVQPRLNSWAVDAGTPVSAGGKSQARHFHLSTL